MKKILLIDDDTTLCQVFQSLLQDAGFHTIVQEDTQHLDEVITQNTPDLIVLDYFLPNENGAEIAAHLKKSNPTKKIPIIMISSSYGIEPIVKKVGVEAFLAKPFDADTLISLIHTFVG